MQKRWQMFEKAQTLKDGQKEKGEKGPRGNKRQNIDWVVAKILENRGIEKKDWEEFLSPTVQFANGELANLLAADELEKLAQRIESAVKKGQPIVIHGDYDVDGICSAAILWETIYFYLGYKKVYPFIPHRQDHGYGLSQESLDEIVRAHGLKSQNPNDKLLITVDCGINAKEEIEYAKKLGFDVLILDHHVKSANSPRAIAILHTRRLCAAGIAFILANYLLGRIKEKPDQKNLEFLTLAALATIADLQPLLGVNRKLVRLGLTRLNQTSRVGLRELMKVANINDKPIGPYEVGFMLSPRLNAMGRLEHALDSLRLLCTRSAKQARQLSRILNTVNARRQKLSYEAFKEAKEKALAVSSKKDAPLVLWDENWHEGIIGLIAAKLTQEFYRPAIIIARGEKVSKASARSIKGLDITKAISRHQNLLLGVGGHKMAAGFSIQTAKIEEFTQKITKSIELELKDKDLSPILLIDLELNSGDISWELLSSLSRLEPHGIGNPAPLFLSRGLEIDNLRWVGKNGEHLKLILRAKNKDQRFSAIGFNLIEKFPSLRAGAKVDLVYSLEENRYNGSCEIQLKIKDLKPLPAGE